MKRDLYLGIWFYWRGPDWFGVNIGLGPWLWDISRAPKTGM